MQSYEALLMAGKTVIHRQLRRLTEHTLHHPILKDSIVLLFACFEQKECSQQKLKHYHLILLWTAEPFNYNKDNHHDTGHNCILKPLIEVDIGKHRLTIYVVVSNIRSNKVNNGCHSSVEHCSNNFRQHGTPEE
jgi:hypothetical protein